MGVETDFKLTAEQLKLVEDNYGLVYMQVHRRGIKDEDLIQEGMLGLINAARMYSKDFGVKFSTYAGKYIWAALHGTYSDKKYWKKRSVTVSYDDPDFYGKLQCIDDCSFLHHPGLNFDGVHREVVDYLCSGESQRSIMEKLNITKKELNVILDNIRGKMDDKKVFGDRTK